MLYTHCFHGPGPHQWAKFALCSGAWPTCAHPIVNMTKMTNGQNPVPLGRLGEVVRMPSIRSMTGGTSNKSRYPATRAYFVSDQGSHLHFVAGLLPGVDQDARLVAFPAGTLTKSLAAKYKRLLQTCHLWKVPSHVAPDALDVPKWHRQIRTKTGQLHVSGRPLKKVNKHVHYR